jgi:hypothetical protein
VKRVIVESPFAPQTLLFVGDHNGGASHTMCHKCLNEEQRQRESARNARYLAAALRDCTLRGESPYASHGLLTLPGVLRDDVPEERALGIRAGFAWRGRARYSLLHRPRLVERNARG